MRTSIKAAISALVVISALGCPSFDSLTPSTTHAPLTVARALEGTWKTTVPVPMSLQTDFCTGNKQTVGQRTWSVTWIVTSDPAFTNVLNIEMHVAQSGVTNVPASCANTGTGYVPWVSPDFFTMTVSSSAMGTQSNNRGLNVSGNYTTDNMALTWNHYECQIYCFGEFSAPQTFILTRQH